MFKLPIILLSVLTVQISSAEESKAKQCVKVCEIYFVGNQSFTSNQLMDQLATKLGSTIDLKDPKAFNADVERLYYFYFNDGYVQAAINPPSIAFSPDKKSVRLEYNLSEGLRYKMGKVEFVGKWLVPRSELLAATNLHNEAFFNYQTLQDDLKTLQAKIGSKKALPLPRTRIREADQEVDVTYELAHKD